MRDAFTWLAYLMIGYYAFVETVFGPIMPFLQNELGFSYTVSSLHFSAFAVGLMIAGILGERVVRRWGRRVTSWGGATGMVAGIVLLAIGASAPVTIAGVFLAGLFGTLFLVIIQAALSDRHGEQRAIAYTEANVLASVCAILAPVLVGGFQQAGASWRWVMVVLIAALIVLALVFRRIKFPEPHIHADASESVPAQRLPGKFWAYWAVMVVAASVEWCMVYWSAGFLQTFVGLSAATAATLVSLFFIAQVIGRFAGSRLTRVMPGSRLLLIAQVIALAGVPLFWLATQPALSIAGFFLAGLGIANFYPLTLSVAIGAAPKSADAASARLSLAGGLALSFAPLTIGAMADRAGLQQAYGLLIILLVVLIAITIGANRWRT